MTNALSMDSITEDKNGSLQSGNADPGYDDTNWFYGESGNLAYDNTDWYDDNNTQYDTYGNYWLNLFVTEFQSAVLKVKDPNTYMYIPDYSMYSGFEAYQYEELPKSNTTSSGDGCFGTQCWDIHMNPSPDGQLVEGILLCCLGIIAMITIVYNARRLILMSCGIAVIVSTLSRAVQNLIDFCVSSKSADEVSAPAYPYPACVFAQAFAFFDSVGYHSFLYMTSVFGLQFACQFVSEAIAKRVMSSLCSVVSILVTVVLAVLTNIKTIIDWINILGKMGAGVREDKEVTADRTGGDPPSDGSTTRMICLMPYDLSKDIFFTTLPLALPGVLYISIAMTAFTCRRKPQGENDKGSTRDDIREKNMFRVTTAVFFLLMATWILTPFLYHVINELTNPHVGIDIHRFIDPMAYMTVILYLWSAKFVQVNARKHLNGSSLQERNGDIPHHMTCKAVDETSTHDCPSTTICDTE